MKKLAILSVAALGLVPAAAVAADLPTPSSNYGLAAEMWAGANILGSSTGDADDPRDNSFGLLGGRASMIFGSESSLMTQLSFEAINAFQSSKTVDEDQAATTGQGTVHLMTGAGLGLLGGGGSVSFQDESTVSFYFGGLEYRAEFEAGSVLLQAGAFDTVTTDDDSPEVFQNGLFAQFAPELMLSNQLHLGLRATYAEGEVESGDSAYLVGWGVKLEQHIEDSPVSLFVAYDGSYVDGSDATFDEHSIVIGLRMALGDSASKEVLNPAVHQWVGLSQRTD